MFTLLEMAPQSSIYSEAIKRDLADITTYSLIEEFKRENWRLPVSFEDLLEFLE